MLKPDNRTLESLVAEWREYASALQAMADMSREQREKSILGFSPYEVGADWDWYAKAFLDHADAVEKVLQDAKAR